METENDTLYQAAVDAISKVFGDTSVSKETTRENLNSLIGEIQIMLDNLTD